MSDAIQTLIGQLNGLREGLARQLPAMLGDAMLAEAMVETLGTLIAAHPDARFESIVESRLDAAIARARHKAAGPPPPLTLSPPSAEPEK